MCQLKSKFGQPLIATLSSLLLRSNEGLTLSSILSAVAEFVSKAANRRQNDISSFLMNDVDTYFTLLQQGEENCQDHHVIGGSDLLLLNIK